MFLFSAQIIKLPVYQKPTKNLENISQLSGNMSASAAFIPAAHQTPLDDELAALALQFEELGVLSEPGKGKHPIDQPPDFEVAFASFQAELENYRTLLSDQKLAQSIGAAVHTDGALIGDITAQELQSHADHRFVLQLSNNDAEIEEPPRHIGQIEDRGIGEWMSTITDTISAQSVVDFSDDETKAGPSMTFTERQADTIKKMSMVFQCVACTEQVPRTSVVTTKCGHRFCTSCIKKLFMRSTQDEGLYPPKCCQQIIPSELVTKHMTADEVATLQLAAIEFTTHPRVYCSNLKCGSFIVPDHVDSSTQRADCPKCGTETCSQCLARYHHDSNCPIDPLMQHTMALAESSEWQTCNACHRIVEIMWGCNHME